MNNRITPLILLLNICFSTAVFAQLATSEWNTHMSYFQGEDILKTDNKVYVVASGSLFSYGINDNSIETYTKVNGLSDVNIVSIAFCDNEQTLVIAYKNGNIDLMSTNGVINIPDLKNKTVYGSKDINNIDINESNAYISTDYGILKLNIAKAEISETYKLTYNEANTVNGVVVLNDIIYAATNNGLYIADNTKNNLQNFASWTKDSNLTNNTLQVEKIILFSNTVVISQRQSSASKIFTLQSNNTWNTLTTLSSTLGMQASSEWLTLNNFNHLYYWNTQFTQQATISNYNFSTNDSYQNTITLSCYIKDEDDNFWIADTKQGLVKYRIDEETSSYTPNGPTTNIIWDIDIANNKVRIVHGSMTASYNNTNIAGALSTLYENHWSNLTKYNGGEDRNEYINVITDPQDSEHFFITSYSGGILEYQDDEFINFYNDGNSSLENAIPGNSKYVRVTAMAFDSQNQLWVINGDVSSQLHVKTSEDWYGYSTEVPSNHTKFDNLEITDNDVKWFTPTHSGSGIIAYDENETYDDTSDDINKHFSIEASNSSGVVEQVSESANALSLDNDGTMWVGTDNGIVLYYNSATVLESDTDPVGKRIARPRNDGTGQSDYLLDGEQINTIAIDGGNRKWIGTTNTGVMLVSADGQDIIHHFTIENSPLPSNQIRKIEINQESGEVFIASVDGLVSFQADATQAEDNFDDIKVYPNPVRETFSGEITITGLVDETLVKITDVSGNLVNQTTSNGGTATWNGNNFYGNRVGTGVYLIFCSDKAGETSGMTKVLVIN